MIIFNCSFVSYLTFILLFSFVIVLVQKSKVVVVVAESKSAVNGTVLEQLIDELK